MDENICDEIFEGWPPAPDLTADMPCILQHSCENFQEMRLMEGEKGQEEYARETCPTQDLPSRLEEPDSGSDTMSIPQDCLVDDHNSILSTLSSVKKSNRCVSAASETPISASSSPPCGAYPEAERAQPGQDLPAELEKSQPGSGDTMISRQNSRYGGPWFFISTPSLGIMLETARTMLIVPSSSHHDTLFDYPDKIRPALNRDGELKEKVAEPLASMSLRQELPSNRLHQLISTPSLGIRVEATPSNCLHQFISTPSLGIRIEATKEPPPSPFSPPQALSPERNQTVNICIRDLDVEAGPSESKGTADPLVSLDRIFILSRCS